MADAAGRRDRYVENVVLSMVFGLSLGIVFMMMRMSKVPALRTIAICYIELIRNTPILVQVFFVFSACRRLASGSAASKRRSWP